jgi:hypothetical protein
MVTSLPPQWIFNKLLSWFQKSVKEAVATEIRSQVHRAPAGGPARYARTMRSEFSASLSR